MRRLPTATAIALLAALAAPLASVAAADTSVRRAGAIAYASGGVTEEDREALAAIAQDFNVKLVLATKAGAYVSDVDVVVTDEAGRRVLDAHADGPWFFARLPVGRYSIEASLNGRSMRRNVTVAARRRSEVDFRWDE